MRALPAIPLALLLGVLGALLGPLPAAAAPSVPRPALEAGPGDEVLRYRWKLGGFVGTLARLFVPGKGEGSLVTVRDGAGTFRTELRVTAGRRRKGEYWLSGSAVDVEAGRTLSAWSSQVVRGKLRERSAEFTNGEEVIDVTSGIALLRHDAPPGSRRMEIWSNGRIYPVTVRLARTYSRPLAGREVTVRHYEIRGRDESGGRPWNGAIDLHLADDEAATPVELFVFNKGVRVNLQLAE